MWRKGGRGREEGGWTMRDKRKEGRGEMGTGRGGNQLYLTNITIGENPFCLRRSIVSGLLMSRIVREYCNSARDA